MPIVKVSDLAYVRLQSPSLDEAEELLTAFGLMRAERTRDRLYMRATDAPHHVHVTELGPSRLRGLAFYVDEEDDLRSEEHTSELQSRVDISYAVFCLKKD